VRILCVTQEFPPLSGGISVFLHNLCTQLCYQGCNVDVLTPVREGCTESDDAQPYRVYRYKELRFLSSVIPFYYTLSKYFKKNYDIVFIGHFMTTTALGALFLKKLRGIPYVILSHGNDLHYSISNRIDKPVANQIIQNAPLMLGNSHVTAERIRQKGYKGSVKILHPGVNINKFRPNIENTDIHRRYNLNGKKVILTVSRLVARKGHDRVLYALSKVVKKIPNIIYLIVGTGEEESRLRNLVNELTLEQHVVFTGSVRQDALPALYCACDIFIMPSYVRAGGHDYEGFGIVFNEANACGKPVIAGRSGGIEDAVVDGVTGLLVNPENTEEISQAISRLLIDREFAQKLGENGRKRTESELSWEKVGQRLDQYLHNVIENMR